MNTATMEYRSAGEINSAMGRVYNHMALAVLTSAAVSYLVSTSPDLMAFLFGTWVKWVVIFLPLVAVMGASVVLANNPPKIIAVSLLHGFAGLMGLSMATIFVVYSMGSIAMAFISASVLFGTMSCYGYFTKRSLEGVGQFMIVGVIALVIMQIINIFVGSSLFAMVLSALAIVIFLGLTAYDTQRIREEVSVETSDAVEVSAAISLYLNFINIFINLLQLFGDKRSD